MVKKRKAKRIRKMGQSRARQGKRNPPKRVGERRSRMAYDAPVLTRLGNIRRVQLLAADMTIE